VLAPRSRRATISRTRSARTTNEAAVEALLRRTAGDTMWRLVHPQQEPPARIDQASELQMKWRTAPGQLWRTSNHRLLCGDSTKAEDVIRLMGEERAALFASDPPYAIGYLGGSHPQSWGNRGAANRDKDWSGKYLEASPAVCATRKRSASNFTAASSAQPLSMRSLGMPPGIAGTPAAARRYWNGYGMSAGPSFISRSLGLNADRFSPIRPICGNTNHVYTAGSEVKGLEHYVRKSVS
jgi:hypothetical protein